MANKDTKNTNIPTKQAELEEYVDTMIENRTKRRVGKGYNVKEQRITNRKVQQTKWDE